VSKGELLWLYSFFLTGLVFPVATQQLLPPRCSLRRDVLPLILGHSLSWALGGIAAGVAGAVGLLRLLGSLMYGVSPGDP